MSPKWTQRELNIIAKALRIGTIATLRKHKGYSNNGLEIIRCGCSLS